MNRKQQKAWDANPMRQTRKILGLTQEQLALLLGCAVFTVSRHENNPIGLTDKHLWRLALKQLLVEGVCRG